MKEFISDFKSSLRLDMGADVAGPGVGRMEGVHSILAEAPPETNGPEDLHFGIMQAVRGCSKRTAAPSRRISWARAGFATGCACLLVLGLVIFSGQNQASMESTIASLGVVVDEVTSGSKQVELLSPLEQELEKVNTDLERTAEHLLASVP